MIELDKIETSGKRTELENFAGRHYKVRIVKGRIKELHCALLDSGKVEDVVDYGEKSLGRRLYRLQHLRLLKVELRV